ncbi:MAG: methyltransferase domain-containing protein [Chloroflexota bacterium]
MSTNDSHYDDLFVAGLEWMWGEGFLSPGGPDEVAEVIGGIDIRGMEVLDIGCGIGGVDVVLVKDHGAAHVIGIDVEAPLLARAAQIAAKNEVANQISFKLVEPGLLPFPDSSFDLVFSKDALIHIPDKEAIYREIYRVLRPNGRLAIGDWFGSHLPPTPEYKEWLVVVDLNFAMGTLETAVSLLTNIGFHNIEAVDRNAWYAENILKELATLQGENFQHLVARYGPELAHQRLKSSSLKKVVVDQGLLRPGHIRAARPSI